MQAILALVSSSKQWRCRLLQCIEVLLTLVQNRALKWPIMCNFQRTRGFWEKEVLFWVYYTVNFNVFFLKWDFRVKFYFWYGDVYLDYFVRNVILSSFGPIFFFFFKLGIRDGKTVISHCTWFYMSFWILYQLCHIANTINWHTTWLVA